MNAPAVEAAALLDLRVEAATGARGARCDLIWGGALLATVRARLEELGLAPESGPRGSSAERRDPAQGGTPTSFVEVLSSAIASYLPPELPLALRFSPPTGALPFLPWERWLTPSLGRPLLRWPYLPSRTAAVGTPLEIAICGSVPRAKGDFLLADHIVAAVAALRAAGPPARFHLFVDAERADELTARLAAEIVAGAVRVVPAAEAEPYGMARRRGPETGEDERSAAIASPWLRWLLGATPRLDLVQFVCHGFLSNGRGHLAFAESPLRNSDPEWSRFVGWRELVTCLDSCGARGLVLSSPSDNWSLSGLFALADQVARGRPGPTAVHDFRLDPTAAALASTVRLALGGSRDVGALAPLPAVALYPPADLLRAFEAAEPPAPMAAPPGVPMAPGTTRSSSPRAVADRLYARIGSLGAGIQDLSFDLSAFGFESTAEEDSEPSSDSPALRTWREKLESFREQEASVSDPGLLYSVKKGIEGARQKIREIQSELRPSAPPPVPPVPPSPPAERWEEASKRVLERHTAEIATQGEAATERSQAMQEGRARALDYVLDLLESPDAARK